jgi:hypothetical protein
MIFLDSGIELLIPTMPKRQTIGRPLMAAGSIVYSQEVKCIERRQNASRYMQIIAGGLSLLGIIMIGLPLGFNQ